MHFKASIVNGIPYGKQFGYRAYEFVQRHVTGQG